MSSELSEPRFHPGNADAQRGPLASYFFERLGVHSMPVIGDGEDYAFPRPLQVNPSLMPTRVAVNIGESFLDNSEKGEFHFLPDLMLVFRQVEVHLNSGSSTVAFNVPAQR